MSDAPPPAAPFERAGLTLSEAERARLAEPARLLEAMLARLRASAPADEPAVIFQPRIRHPASRP